VSSPHRGQDAGRLGDPGILAHASDQVTGAIQTEGTDAILTSRGLVPADLEIRLRADISSRLPVLVCYGAAV